MRQMLEKTGTGDSFSNGGVERRSRCSAHELIPLPTGGCTVRRLKATPPIFTW
jgi:hypothetical protein